MRLKELLSSQKTDRGTSGVVADIRTLLSQALSPRCLAPIFRLWDGQTGVLCLNCDVTWLQQTFSEADKNRDGTLSIGEVHQLLHKLNVNLPKQKVRQMFQVRPEAAGFPQNKNTSRFCR